MISRKFLTLAFLTLTVYVSRTDCRKRDRSDTLVEKRFSNVRGICQSNEFQCQNTYCISLDQVCDTHNDCLGGEDENNCPTDCTGQNQFKCESSNKCIGLIDKCDGHIDCTDYSDEAFCSDFECPADRFKCIDSNECINKHFVCDSLKDCRDGSDERNCLNGTCGLLWMCADKDRCIPRIYVCDGVSDCLDSSDEAGCSCATYQLKCNNGYCVPNSYKCDGINDCGDLTDEQNCPLIPSNICANVMTYEDCFHMNETTHPICTIQADGDKFCRKFCGFCT